MKEAVLSQSIIGRQDRNSRLETGGRIMEELIAGSLSDLLACSVYVHLDSLFWGQEGKGERRETCFSFSFFNGNHWGNAGWSVSVPFR